MSVTSAETTAHNCATWPSTRNSPYSYGRATESHSEILCGVRMNGLHTAVVTSGSQRRGVKRDLSPSRDGFPTWVKTELAYHIGRFPVLPAAPQITSQRLDIYKYPADSLGLFFPLALIT